MSVLSNLLTGSFAGIPFLFRKSSAVAGRKHVVNEYPFRDTRTVVDLGRDEGVYQLTVFVTGLDVDYYQRCEQLEQAFDKGYGIFVHPTKGRMKAFCTNYTSLEDTTQIGCATYEVTIYATSQPVYPTSVLSAASNVDNLYQGTINALDSALTDAWSVYISYLNALAKYRAYLNRITDELNAVKYAISVSKDALTPFQHSVNVASNPDNQGAIVTTQGKLATTLRTLYTNMGLLSTNTTDTSTLNQQFFGYVTPSVTNTSIKTQAVVDGERNRIALDTHTNASALVNECLNTSLTTYATEDDIELQTSRLKAQHDFVLNGNFSTDIFGEKQQIIDQDTIAKVTEIRDATIAYLTQQRASARSITTVYVQQMPLTVLTYNIYESMDDYDALVNLNAFGNPSLVSGDVKILVS